MNIKQAKEQIKKTMQVYFSKDEFGNYALSPEYQRPVFLMGPPGIGKTAIMEQIAQELQVGLVSYSMTHHTRQSALGLPFIIEKQFGDQTCSVAEYTMSEIVASVYNKIEKSGLQEGILFLDEVNCVSETLAPSMLQFLQYKTFGMHAIPKGWIVVTAGNPAEFNKSVRDFDIVTWDRLKRIDVEANLEVWKEYAIQRDVHAAIRAFLELHPDDFYRIETTVDGKKFITARGWEDLSKMMVLYEQQGLEIDRELFGQYIQFEEVAEEFSVFFDLFQKYKSDYQMDQILAGTEDESIRERARKAPFDEKITLVSMLLDSVSTSIKYVMLREKWMLQLRDALRQLQRILKEQPGLVNALMQIQTQERRFMENQILRGIITKEAEYTNRCYQRELAEIIYQVKLLPSNETDDNLYAEVKRLFAEYTKVLKEQAADTSAKLGNLFTFVEEVFGNGQEMLILLTELTKNRYASQFIGRYGSDKYKQYSDQLMIRDRQNQILDQLIMELE